MKKKKIIYGFAAVTAVAALAMLLLLFNANKIIQYELQQFLGKGFSVADVSLRWGHVEARDIKLLGTDSKEAFSAKDLSVSANVIGLLRRENVISDITLDTPYLLIQADKKGDIILPWQKRGNRERKSLSRDRSVRPFIIKKFRVEKGSLDYLDRKVSVKPALIRLREIDATVEDVSAPLESRSSTYDFEAAIPGSTKKGHLTASGILNLKTKDTKTKLSIRDVDITQLRPYYEKKGDAEVTGGLLSVKADISIENSRINSSGTMTIEDLQFDAGSGSILGLPVRAVTNMLKDNNDRISFDFVIEGDLNNPKFSITESLVRKLTLSLAKSLGMPIESIGKSVFDLGGSALKKLFR